MIPLSSKCGKAVLALHGMAALKLVFLLVASGGLLTAGIGFSTSGVLAGMAFSGILSAVLAEAAAQGLSRNKVWGWILAVGVSLLNLPSLLFPLSVAVIWYLLPDLVRADLEALLKQEMGTKLSLPGQSIAAESTEGALENQAGTER